MKSWRLIAFCLLGGALMPVRSELILTNYYSSPKALKIMPFGDSITDDCEVNGAWRLYLQPLLSANGYAYFFFTGRQSSSPVGNFTSVLHEGYCGAVIAYPGVNAAHQYPTASNYMENIVPGALSIASYRPALILFLIGVNDIGRGRDPNYVATNDMSNLLDITFSNLPSANVIIAKVTSLQNANILGYNAYATNIPIFNAALQAVVNQRRALGQNIFLADMYSVVDPNTMFQSDGVHPNGTGLQAIANEWLARIQAITIRTNQLTTTLIHGGDVWKYSDTGQDLETNWTQLNFDDSGWSSGTARLGYGDPATVTTVSYGSDPNNKYPTTYFRHSFVVPGNAGYTNLSVRVAVADGAVVWLNGQEIFRTNMPAGPITYTNQALAPMGEFRQYVFNQTNLVIPALPAGTNVIAVEVHASSPTNSSLGFDFELLGTGFLIPSPRLSIQNTNSNVVVGWPDPNGANFTLYTTTNPAAAWTVMNPTQTNGGQVSVTVSPGATLRLFRLQRP